MLNSFLFQIWTLFVKFESYSNFVQAYGIMSLFWLWLYAYRILYNMAFMWWCSILGPGRILLSLIVCFITFYVRRALQQKQQRRIIYVMQCDLCLVKIADKFQSEIRIPNVRKSNSNSSFKTKVWKIELRLTSLVLSKPVFTSYPVRSIIGV